MKKAMIKKVTAFLIAGTMLITVVPSHNKVTAEAKVNSINYDFFNNEPGMASGKITISTTTPGDYQLYWADDKGNLLSYDGVKFSQIANVSTTSDNLTATYKVPSSYTAIPDGAKELVLTDSNNETICTYNIPEEKQFSEGEVQYQFGLMSDVHFNRYPEENGTQDDSVPAFDKALQFINDRNIDFVGLTGDLSNQGEDLAYTKFNNAIGKYPNMTVYTCMGNHDVSWTGSAEEHVKSFAKQVNVKRITDKNIKEISSNGVDFVYEKNGDIFVFFSQTKAAYTKYVYLVSPEQLTWLEKVLNKYAEKNVYLFFHTYLASENGDVTTAVGNLKNPGGYTYDLTYVFGNPSEVRLRKILNKYANVTMFNGHSHWAYDQQKYNGNLNIGNINSKKTGASLVHIASVSAPRTIEETATKRDENNGVRSEGTVAVKYKNSTVYIGTDFKNGKYLAYATYLNKDGKKSKPQEIIKINKTKITKIGRPKKISKKSKKYKTQIKYKKIPNAYKYEIQYGTNRKFKAAKTKRTKNTKYTISKLKNKKTYYIRVRAYGYQFGERVYGKWSITKKLKIKRKK